MIIGIGTDIVDCTRIQRSYQRFGDKILERILTPKEREQLPLSESFIHQWLAARFAVKEAAVKALGTGFSHGISLQHVEVLRDEGKAPTLTFYEYAHEYAKKLGVTHNHVSYSHEQKFAVAFVTLEKR